METYLNSFELIKLSKSDAFHALLRRRRCTELSHFLVGDFGFDFFGQHEAKTCLLRRCSLVFFGGLAADSSAKMSIFMNDGTE
jgi:hypothetical protein